MILFAARVLAQDPAPSSPADVQPRVRRPLAERFGTSAFRANLPAGGATAGTRVAFVADFDGVVLGEVTLRGELAWHVFAVAVETAATAGASPRWNSAGFGNTVLDLRLLFGRGSTHAVGIRGVGATGERYGPLGPVAWWGTVPEATTPTWGLALAYEGATRRWVWHFHVGQHTSPLFSAGIGPQLWDVGALLATIQPVAHGWAIAAELEAATSVSPFHIRLLARHEFGGGLTADAGFAVPMPGILDDPTLQVIGRFAYDW